MSVPPKSESSSINMQTHNSGFESQSIGMEFDIVTDVPGTLENYIRLAKLGRFREATKLWSDALEEHCDCFPVVAEHAEVLYLQGDYDSLLSFLDPLLGGPTVNGKDAVTFGKDEMNILHLYRDIALQNRCVRIGYVQVSDRTPQIMKDILGDIEERADSGEEDFVGSLLPVQATVLTLLLRLSATDGPTAEQLPMLLLDMFVSLCDVDVRKIEHLVCFTATTSSRNMLCTSIVQRMVQECIAEDHSTDPAACLFQLSIAVAFCEQFPLATCRSDSEKTTYITIKAQATRLACMLGHLDEYYHESGLQNRLTLLDLNEIVASDRFDRFDPAIFEFVMRSATELDDYRQQSVIGARALPLISQTSISVTKDPVNVTVGSFEMLKRKTYGFLVEKYACAWRYQSNVQLSAFPEVLTAFGKSLGVRLLSCLDSLQCALPPVEATKVLLVRMRLWRWLETYEWYRSKTFNEGAKLIHVVRDIVDVFEKAGQPFQPSTHGQFMTGMLAYSAQEIETLTTLLHRCRSAGAVMHTETPGSPAVTAVIMRFVGVDFRRLFEQEDKEDTMMSPRLVKAE